MITVVIGGAGCGKSKIAEDISQKLGGNLIYIATMPIKTGDDYKVIERHHKLRAGKGFETLERQGHLIDIPKDCTVLLECISTYTANIVFSGEECPDFAELMYKEIKALAENNNNLTMVTVDINRDGIIYDEYTENYKAVLAKLNHKLFEMADLVIESAYGVPNVLKGENIL